MPYTQLAISSQLEDFFLQPKWNPHWKHADVLEFRQNAGPWYDNHYKYFCIEPTRKRKDKKTSKGSW